MDLVRSRKPATAWPSLLAEGENFVDAWPAQVAQPARYGGHPKTRVGPDVTLTL